MKNSVLVILGILSISLGACSSSNKKPLEVAACAPGDACYKPGSPYPPPIIPDPSPTVSPTPTPTPSPSGTAATIQVDPVSGLAFGSVPSGNYKQLSVTLKNTGGVKAAYVASVAPAQPFLLTSNGCTNLAPNQTCQVVLQFTAPAQTGNYSSDTELLFVDELSNSVSSGKILLSGVSIKPGELQVVGSPTYDFTKVRVGYTYTTPNFLTFKNTGQTDITSLVLSINFPYLQSNSTCTGTLIPGATCQLKLSFAPQGFGKVDDQLKASYTSAGLQVSAKPVMSVSGLGANAQVLMGAANASNHVKSYDWNIFNFIGSFFPTYAGTWAGGSGVVIGTAKNFDANGDGLGDYLLGTAAGGPSRVEIRGHGHGKIKEFEAFSPSSTTSGVHVAACSGIMAFARGQGSGLIDLEDVSNSAKVRRGLNPHGGNPTFGLNIACGDLDADGNPDLIAAPVVGSYSDLRVIFNMRRIVDDPSYIPTILGFAPYGWLGGTDPTHKCGTSVAIGNIVDDSKPEIIVSGTGPANCGTEIRVFNQVGGSFPELTNYRQTLDFGNIKGGGVWLSAGDTNGDGYAELIAGATFLNDNGTINHSAVKIKDFQRAGSDAENTFNPFTDGSGVPFPVGTRVGFTY